eukprot:Skav211892  [mRNA]  locus=scaffold2021:2262:4410:+ [translate_table: standard]
MARDAKRDASYASAPVVPSDFSTIQAAVHSLHDPNSYCSLFKGAPSHYKDVIPDDPQVFYLNFLILEAKPFRHPGHSPPGEHDLGFSALHDLNADDAADSDLLVELVAQTTLEGENEYLEKVKKYINLPDGRRFLASRA